MGNRDEIVVSVPVGDLRAALDRIKEAIDELGKRIPATGTIKIKTTGKRTQNPPYPTGVCQEPPIPIPLIICKHLDEVVRLLREICQALLGGMGK